MVSSGNRQIGSHNRQKAQKPKDDTQIPRPDLRFAIERKQRSKTRNGARAQTKHPESKHKICQVDTGGMSHRVIKNIHYETIKIFIHGPVNSVKQCISKLPFKKEANCDITLETCTQRKHSLRFLLHVLFQASAIESWKGRIDDHNPIIAAKVKSAVTVCCQAVPHRGNGKDGPDDVVRQGQAANHRKVAPHRTVKHAEMSLSWSSTEWSLTWGGMFFFSRPTPLGFRQVVQHAVLHAAYWLIPELNIIPLRKSGLQKTALIRACTSNICRQSANHDRANKQSKTATEQKQKNTSKHTHTQIQKTAKPRRGKLSGKLLAMSILCKGDGLAKNYWEESEWMLRAGRYASVPFHHTFSH